MVFFVVDTDTSRPTAQWFGVPTESSLGIPMGVIAVCSLSRGE